MKNKFLIITVAFLAVIICLILSMLLFYAVQPKMLVSISIRYRYYNRSMRNFNNKQPDNQY